MCGLDMGSTWAKTVKISTKGKSVLLNSFARLPWSRKDLDGKAQQGARISALWEHLQLRDKVVVTSMAGHSVIVKRIFFKAGPPKNLEQGIQEEARQYIPFDLNDVYLDYQVMGQGQKEDTLEVMLVASKKTVVQDLIKVMENSGLSLGVVDVDAFALSNCFEFNYPELRNEPAYLLDIGGTQSIFTIFWNNQPVFFREMSFGGRQLTSIISSRLNISFFEAEVIKLKGPSQDLAADGAEISMEIAATLKTWTDEIKRLIGFYQTSVPEAGQASRIFLSGGGALLPDIQSIFQEQLGIEVKLMDPWKNLKTSVNDFDSNYLESVKPQFAVATGLALRGII